MVLTGHGSQAPHLPEQPLQDLVATTQIGRDKGSGLVGKIKQYCARLEHGQGRASIFRSMVNNGRNTVVGGNAQELRFELITKSNVYRHNAVG